MKLFIAQQKVVGDHMIPDVLVGPEGFEPIYLPIMSRMLIPYELEARC